MLPILLTILVSAIAFVATNLENLLILLAYVHSPRYSLAGITLGYMGGTGVLLLICYGVSQISLMMPQEGIHYLGVLPISLGVWELIKHRVQTPDPLPDQPDEIEPTAGSSQVQPLRQATRVGAVTLASGGDSLVVFGAVFADTRFSADLVILVTGILMSALWIALARWVSRQAWISRPLQQFEDYILPILLIGIGIFIWLDTPGDMDR